MVGNFYHLKHLLSKFHGDLVVDCIFHYEGWLTYGRKSVVIFMNLSVMFGKNNTMKYNRDKLVLGI